MPGHHKKLTIAGLALACPQHWRSQGLAWTHWPWTGRGAWWTPSIGGGGSRTAGDPTVWLLGMITTVLTAGGRDREETGLVPGGVGGLCTTNYENRDRSVSLDSGHSTRLCLHIWYGAQNIVWLTIRILNGELNTRNHGCSRKNGMQLFCWWFISEYSPHIFVDNFKTKPMGCPKIVLYFYLIKNSISRLILIVSKPNKFILRSNYLRWSKFCQKYMVKNLMTPEKSRVKIMFGCC